MNMKFYKCEVCGQIIAIVQETGVPVICCGQNMTRIETNSIGAAEKHIPVYSVEDGKVQVSVSSITHPMGEDHYIQWIALQTKAGNQRKVLQPGDEPKACFFIDPQDEVVAVYAYCNLHSLWVG